MNIVPTTSNATPIVAAANTIVLAAPGAEKFWKIFSVYAQNVSATVTRIAWRDGAAGALVHPYTLTQYMPWKHRFGYPFKEGIDGNPRLGYIKGNAWKLTENTALYLNTDSAGQIHWTIEAIVVDLYGHEA